MYAGIARETSRNFYNRGIELSVEARYLTSFKGSLNPSPKLNESMSSLTRLILITRAKLCRRFNVTPVLANPFVRHSTLPPSFYSNRMQMRVHTANRFATSHVQLATLLHGFIRIGFVVARDTEQDRREKDILSWLVSLSTSARVSLEKMRKVVAWIMHKCGSKICRESN